MPLKLSLKPGEKFVLNGAVLANGDKRTNLVIQNKACLLREKDIIQPDETDTPAKRIYFPIMMMYLDADDAKHRLVGFPISSAQYTRWQAEVWEYRRSQLKR
jgi:flagellar protein FlbT